MKDVPAEVCEAYGIRPGSLSPLAGGLTHRTYLAQADSPIVLQAMHGAFEGCVNDDIDVLTTHLAEHFETPRLVRTRTGASHLESGGQLWRALTWLEGTTHHVLDSEPMLASAGALVGRVHSVLRNVEHRFRFVRPGAHDTARHLARLAERARLPHRRGDVLAPLASAILSFDWPDWSGLPARIIHGDLKLSNVLFRNGEAVALLDLDTFQHADVAIEMGDACRSWCNPLGEDHPAPSFRADLYAAAMQGYLSEAPWLEAEERQALGKAPIRIALELASRFCLDAYEEHYFRWDRSFASASHHNELRARAQLALARSARAALAPAGR